MKGQPTESISDFKKSKLDQTLWFVVTVIYFCYTLLHPSSASMLAATATAADPCRWLPRVVKIAHRYVLLHGFGQQLCFSRACF